MSIPDFQTIMLPLVEFANDGKEHSVREAIEALADHFELTPEERKELLPSGRQLLFDNRVSWSKFHLTKAQVLESTRRGYFRITDRGRALLASNPQRIDMTLLNQYPEYVQFRTKSEKKESPTPQALGEDDSVSPEEAIEEAYQQIRDELANELLDTVSSCSPAFFEQLVVDLLVKMGYGGTRRDAGRAIGRSGDGGIDGIINEDRLGLDVVYIQAKRWEGTVSRPEIQKFVGALQGQRARKGVFITTSNFSAGAKDYASRIDSRIVLIDGEQLAQLMIDYDMGVSSMASYELKRIDSDYFIED